MFDPSVESRNIMTKTKRELKIAIDRGGTFTDCIASRSGREDIVIKILSVDPNNYKDAPTEAIRRVLEIHRNEVISRDQPLDLCDVAEVRLGTTVSTNALLERKGAEVALFVTKGFKDILTIGDQSRPYMFDFKINRREILAKDVWEVDERVTMESSTEYKAADLTYYQNFQEANAISGEPIRIIEPLDEISTKQKLMEAKLKGYKSIAVCLLHSYIFTNHERKIREIAESVGFEDIVLSSDVSSMLGFVGRAHSSVADAYVTPVIKDYVRNFASGFVEGAFDEIDCQIMKSDGGLINFQDITGLCSLLSGPAGGVIGYSKSTYDDSVGTPLIGFDMGGTSTDVSRYAGKLEHVFETITSGVLIRTPQLDINTVAAGGGSILKWENGLMTVGPESASSHPGPACYRKGGPLTVTDANLITGRLVISNFPKIFGPDENEPLDYDTPLNLFESLTTKINADTGKSLSVYEVAEGFIKVANESMCRPIRTLTESKGHKTASHVLCSFGGAGGQHACEIAQRLGIKKVCIHRYSSLLSAYGIALAETVHEEHRPCSALLAGTDSRELFERELEEMQNLSESKLKLQSKIIETVESQKFMSMKYKGSNTALMIEYSCDDNIRKKFEEQHVREFGLKSDRPIIVEGLRVRSVGKSFSPTLESPLVEINETEFSLVRMSPQITQKVFFNSQFSSAPVYNLTELAPGKTILGPAFIVDATQTLVIIPGASANICQNSVVINVPQLSNSSSDKTVDPIELSIFNHRFMSIAEQTGRALQRSSVSTNIKERLDFTCSVFSATGGLVANAPHVPAMIGSMAFAVKWQIDHWGSNLHPGDVIISNSPISGGTHLPDITLMTPVFDEKGIEILFWTASRGHHADIGGILPGSMPPNSTELWQEGAIMRAVKVVEEDVFNEDLVTELLYTKPARIPGNHGTRTLQDNISDIKAQIAANAKGAVLIRDLMKEYGRSVVQLYMEEIQYSSELAIRNLLKSISTKYGSTKLEAEDQMDDGSAIHLAITINSEDGSAVFDFTGTGMQVNGNWNAPVAVTHSSIIFSLRCMVDGEIPLNQGCLAPIDIVIPEGCFLRPGEDVAVCAGNGLTSQRIVDVIFKAFGFAAACGGDMSNFTIGVDGENGFGYYETVCNGSGAGPDWNGSDAVQTNMTNTKITDAEHYEQRYPVLLRRFAVRPDSGGRGEFNGGNGAIREIEVTSKLVACILAERRVFQPYGMAGGEPGKKGETLVERKNGSMVNLGGKSSITVYPGDKIYIITPGGGGYGKRSEEKRVASEKTPAPYEFIPRANGTVEMMRVTADGN